MRRSRGSLPRQGGARSRRAPRIPGRSPPAGARARSCRGASARRAGRARPSRRFSRRPRPRRARERSEENREHAKRSRRERSRPIGLGAVRRARQRRSEDVEESDRDREPRGEREQPQSPHDRRKSIRFPRRAAHLREVERKECARSGDGSCHGERTARRAADRSAEDDEVPGDRALRSEGDVPAPDDHVARHRALDANVRDDRNDAAGNAPGKNEIPSDGSDGGRCGGESRDGEKKKKKGGGRDLQRRPRARAKTRERPIAAGTSRRSDTKPTSCS